MIQRFNAQQRPTETWSPPRQVVGAIEDVLNMTMYVSLGLSIIAVIVFGALLVIDRDRGEPVSATAPYMRALQIALGVFIISGASSLAAWLIV